MSHIQKYLHCKFNNLKISVRATYFPNIKKTLVLDLNWW